MPPTTAAVASGLSRRIPSRVSLISMSDLASPVLSNATFVSAFVSGRNTPAASSRNDSCRGSPGLKRHASGSFHQHGFVTSYFGARPTAQAFAEYRAHRTADAEQRLHKVETAAMRRAARLRQVRTQQHVMDSRRQYITRRVNERTAEARRRVEERQAQAEERRAEVLQRRMDALKKADVRRAAVRDRILTLRRAAEAIHTAECRLACESLQPLSDLVVDACHQAAGAHGHVRYCALPADVAPTPFAQTLHGCFTHQTTMADVEKLLVADARGGKQLSNAAQELLNILLAAAELPSDVTPLVSPEKGCRKSDTTSPAPEGVKNADPSPSWVLLQDPANRQRAALLIVAAHYSALDAITPNRTEDAWEQCKQAYSVVMRLRQIILSATSKTRDDAVPHVAVVEALSALASYMEAQAASDARRKAEMIAELTRALVQLKVGESARQRDIARTAQRAVAAGAQSPQAMRERQVAPRRAVLTSAVTQQIDKVVRRLRAVGGDDAVTAAQAEAEAAIAAAAVAEDTPQRPRSSGIVPVQPPAHVDPELRSLA